MELKVHIDAPELVGVLNNIAIALAGFNVVAPEHQVIQPETPSMPQQSTPITPAAPQQPIPQASQIPTAPQYTPTVPQYQPPAGLPQQSPVAPPQAAPVPTATNTYTMDQLAVAATQLVDAGRQGEIVNLLNSFGVQALTVLPKERYGEFATALRGLGARI